MYEYILCTKMDVVEIFDLPPHPQPLSLIGRGELCFDDTEKERRIPRIPPSLEPE
jgi:hypothetical protein